MPLYDYQCSRCSTKFELRRGFNDRSTAACPKCRGEACHIFSPVPIIFKGAGFYTTDNRKNGGNGSTPEGAGDDADSQKSQ